MFSLDTEYGNLPEYRTMINQGKVPSYYQNAYQSQICHECTKSELRQKVEMNEAYNEYNF